MVLASNRLCLQKKQDGRQVKYADGQIENNGASTPVLFSPWIQPGYVKRSFESVSPEDSLAIP